MKNLAFYSIVATLVIISGCLSYYIFANTYKTDQPLFNFQATNYIYETITADLLGSTYVTSSRYVPAEEIATDYGRGTDIGKVLSEAVGIITGPNEKEFYVFDTQYFIENLKLPFKISADNSVYIDKDNYLRNCERNTYDLKFNSRNIQNDIDQGASSISLDSYLTNPESLELISLCDEYNVTKTKVTAMLGAYFEDTNLTKYFKYSVDTKRFEVSDTIQISEAILELRDDFARPPLDPVYEEVNNAIYLLSYYENGYEIDVEQTLSNLSTFLENPENGFNVETYLVEPTILASNKPVFDFSNQISEGKTRMELIRNGFTNWVIQFADFGLYEIHNYVINPGQEFSFLGTISPSNGLTKSGFPIDGGICNATTTIFRAALEAGLPITERYYHYKNVPSYDWPYTMNIVDSAYYTDPKVDLKFVNDTPYPILMRFEKYQEDGYQYNTVKLYTSKNFDDRKVDLVNWKKWNEFSNTHFEASFDRVVYQNGVKLREDNFYSRYLD